MKTKLILSLLFLLLSISIFAKENLSQQKHEFKGVIQTQNSEVIAGANLYFKNGERKFTVVTNMNGEFRTELESGNYEITVNNILSSAFKAFIKIQSEGANPNDVTFIVKPNKNPCGLGEDEICPKPAHPAIAIKTKGEVTVKVKIDNNGQVVEAVAQSGHPLLRPNSILASRKSKFEIADTSELREIELTYIFLGIADEENKNLSRYKNVYRIIVETSINADCFNDC